MSVSRERQRSPLFRFQCQRSAAKYRGIEWRLTFEEWWGIWESSGRWEQRGKGAGKYVMCRRGDVGAYEVGNVFIATGEQNVSEGTRRPGSDLPMGVRRNGRKFCAVRGIGGRSRRVFLGNFDTPEEAYAAYLRAAPQSQVAA